MDFFFLSLVLHCISGFLQGKNVRKMGNGDVSSTGTRDLQACSQRCRAERRPAREGREATVPKPSVPMPGDASPPYSIRPHPSL